MLVMTVPKTAIGIQNHTRSKRKWTFEGEVGFTTARTFWSYFKYFRVEARALLAVTVLFYRMVHQTTNETRKEDSKK